MSPPDVAIVHERFTEIGGSERVVEELLRTWPGATVHAAIADPAALPEGLRETTVSTSWLQRAYRPGRGYAALLPLLPMAMRTLDVGHPDVVVVSHHAFAGRIRPPAGTSVVTYVHTPARWIWDPRMLANEVGGPLGRAGLRAFAATQRRPDRAAARRADRLVVNSRFVAERVERWWGCSADVVHPPIDIDRFRPGSAPREDFFLLAGRLVPYKRPEVAVEAAKRAGVRLVVAGDGRARAAVDAAAEGATGIEVLGSVDGATLRDLMQRCAALVFPGEEDFGMVPVEAQACGAPVIARRVGGVLDSVADGVTGVLYDGGAEALAVELGAFDPASFDSLAIRRHAETFGGPGFRARMAAVVEDVLKV